MNIITVEDPVEYQLRGINQIQVNPKIDLTFAGGLRSILRQDPDVIMVGEIRDGETAEIAIQASLTGHLVFSTLHTNDAATAVTRLIDMGIEPFLVPPRCSPSSPSGSSAALPGLPQALPAGRPPNLNSWASTAKATRGVLYRPMGCPPASTPATAAAAEYTNF